MKNAALRISLIVVIMLMVAFIALLATGGTISAMAAGLAATFAGMIYLGEVERHSVDIHSTFW